MVCKPGEWLFCFRVLFQVRYTTEHTFCRGIPSIHRALGMNQAQPYQIASTHMYSPFAPCIGTANISIYVVTCNNSALIKLKLDWVEISVKIWQISF